MSETAHKKRVVLFTSYYRGKAILENLFADPELMNKMEIVGVVTDTPGKKGDQKRNCPDDTRHWQYGYTADDANMVADIAAAHGIPVYRGKIKTPEFYELLENHWKPDIAYSATFGQLLDQRVIDAAPGGVYNTHPGDGEVWPNLPGLGAFETIAGDGRKDFALALHQMNAKLDDGPLVYYSPKIPVPHEDMKSMALGQKVQHLHKIIAPAAADLVNTHLRCELGMALTPQQEVGYAAQITALRAKKFETQRFA